MFVEPAPDPWCRVLESRWQTLRDEALALREEQWYPWGQVEYNVASGASLFPFAFRYRPTWFHGDLEANGRVCPAIRQLLDDLPGIFTLSLSRLQPGARVQPHSDHEEPGYLRMHLALQSDPGAWFRCGDRRVGWHDGRLHAFFPSTEHEVVHDGSRARIVLLIDVEAGALQQFTEVRRAT